MMYCLKMSTHGISEYYIAKTLVQIRKQIDKTLQEVSITYHNGMLWHLRTFQNKLKDVKEHHGLIWQIENTKIVLIKAVQLKKTNKVYK